MIGLIVGVVGKALLAGELEEGVYRGTGAYRPIINKREGAIAAGKYTGFVIWLLCHLFYLGLMGLFVEISMFE